jgi:hypothetical protein
MHGIALGDVYPFHPHPFNPGVASRVLTNRNRALLPSESYTGPVGTKLTANAVHDLRCQNRGFARAIALGAPPPSARGFAIGCSGGDSWFLGSFGPSAASVACASNEALIGIAGTNPSSSTPQTVFGVCSLTSEISAGRITPSRFISAYPTNGSMNYLRLCPAGMVVDGLSGHGLSASFSHLSMHCQGALAGFTRAERRLSIAGQAPADSNSATNDLVKCAGRSALRGFLGLRKDSTIYGFGGVCVNIEARSGSARVLPTAGALFETFYVAPTVGDANAEDRFQATSVTNPAAAGPTQCADDQALMGANIAAGSSGRVTFVQGVCANVEQWTNPNVAAPAQSALVGFGNANGVPPLQLRCERGELLVGAQVRHSNRNTLGGRTIDTIQPICRDFRAF